MDNREIDKLIAEKIMGWKQWHFKNSSRIPGAVAFEYDALVPPEYDGSDLQYLDMIIPHYSTDITAAWRVVEKMQQREDYVSFRISHNINYGMYLASWGLTQWAQAETAPMTICLAVLKAMGIEPKTKGE